MPSGSPKLTVVNLPGDGNFRVIRGLCSIAIASIAIPDSVEEIIGLSKCPFLETVVFGPQSHLRRLSGLFNCKFQVFSLLKDIVRLEKGALISADFRMLVLHADSQLRVIEFDKDSGRRSLFIAPPESYLAANRRRMHVRLLQRPLLHTLGQAFRRALPSLL
jgi:hypothetical protein